MTDAADIKDETSLRDWLATRPRQYAVWIAHRTALRVLPLWGQEMDAEWARKRKLTALPLLRCDLISAVAVTVPTAEIKLSAAATATTAATATRAATATAATTAAADAAAANAVWQAVRGDAEMLEKGQVPGALWPRDIPEFFTKADARMQRIWQADPPARWDFWRRWWEAAKAGKPLNPQLQLAIVEGVDDDTWEDPDATAARIAEIEQGFVPDEPPDQPQSAEQAFSRNTRAVHAQVHGLIVFVEQEHLALCGLNDVPQTLQASLEARKELLEQIKSLLEEMVAALEGDISTGRGAALQVVQKNLPAVVEKSTELAKVEPDPEVSVYITSISSTIEHMTKRGTPGHIAYFTAVGDHVFKATKGWVTKHRQD